MYTQGETNPYFHRPLQQELHEDDSCPTSPLVQPPRQETQFPRPLQPESRQDHRPSPLVKQPRPQRKHSKPRHTGQLQPTNLPVQEPQSQPSGGLVPPLQLQGQHPQPQSPQGPRQGHRQPHNLWQPRNQPTKDAFTWFATVFCAIFWVVIIVGGIIVLIVYLVYRPRSPQFAVSSATLNAAYLDMGYLLNADVTLLANFTNPSKRVSVDFSYMYINLYYGSTIIATQYIEPFSAARGVSKFGFHWVKAEGFRGRWKAMESCLKSRVFLGHGLILEGS